MPLYCRHWFANRRATGSACIGLPAGELVPAGSQYPAGAPLCRSSTHCGPADRLVCAHLTPCVSALRADYRARPAGSSTLCCLCPLQAHYRARPAGGSQRRCLQAACGPQPPRRPSPHAAAAAPGHSRWATCTRPAALSPSLVQSFRENQRCTHADAELARGWQSCFAVGRAALTAMSASSASSMILPRCTDAPDFCCTQSAQHMSSLAFAGKRGAAAQAAAVEGGGANGHDSIPDPAAAQAEADEAAPGTGQHRTASSSVQGSASAPAPAAATPEEEAPYRAALWAKQTLPGHDLTANASWNAASLDSSASCCQVPLTLALDLSSKDRPDGIQYRVGLHQVRRLLIGRKDVKSGRGLLHY